MPPIANWGYITSAERFLSNRIATTVDDSSARAIHKQAPLPEAVLF